MKARTLILALAFLATSTGLALAGDGNRLPVPTLGDAGVVALALGLVGGGIAALRRRSR